MSRETSNSSTKAGGDISPRPRPLRNVFQRSGSEAACEVTKTEKACVIRVDMPGSLESDLTYWTEGNIIHFFADEPAIPEYQHSGREYGGSIILDAEASDVKGAKAKLINGVLWITVPKIPGCGLNRPPSS